MQGLGERVTYLMATAAFLCGCGGAAPSRSATFAGHTVFATAPPGISEQQLGAPFDARFVPLQGYDAATLFPDADAPRSGPLNQMLHEYVLVDSEEKLAANMRGWGFLTAGAAAASERRHASYRAMQLGYVRGMDDATEMREPPAGAVYYLSRIFYGRSYEVVFSGRTRDFHAGVRAALIAVSGSMDAFVSRHRLTTNASGRGLVPRESSAIFAKTPEQIEAAYVASGPEVPIVVEFRQIPNTRALSAAIPWPEPVQVELRLSDLSVANDGTWGATPWRLTLACQVNGSALSLEQAFVWEGSTRDGGTYPINRGWPLELFPGDRLDCGVDGAYSGPLAGNHTLPSARMPAAVQVDATTAVSGAMLGQSDDVRYQVTFVATKVR